MIDFDEFFDAIAGTPLAPFREAWQAAIAARYEHRPHGEHERWQRALEALPKLPPGRCEPGASAVAAIAPAAVTADQRQALQQSLMALHPWRKGPFSLHGIDIDAEWRSDWKWQRVSRHISPLHNRRVLDVGCGNGYYLWRMVAEGASLALGVDPTRLCLFQFHAVKQYLGALPAYLLPLRSEDLPADMRSFDTVFSMGVLYHRRSPFDHLAELRGALKPGGELVLETLIIDGAAGQVLVPGDRYAQMRNVWFLPSAPELLHWLAKAGFEAARLVDITQTSTEEQRRTDWMRFHSLEQFLDPDDHDRTVEGYPAPRRGIFIARAPA